MNDQVIEKIPQHSDILNPSFLRKLLTMMVKIRKLEERVADLVTAERINCPCHLYTGQEAIATGVCAALNDSDLVFSTHRSHGHYLAKGGDIRSLMSELFGKKTGCSHGHGGSMHIASPEKGLPGSSAIVAGTISLAVGAGLAFSLQKKKRISVAFFGDGATNEGGFYESLNFAALHKLPVIFICENNQYSTHMPIDQCLANTKIYEIAEAFNITSRRIDGNNVLDIFNATQWGIELIREGNGPVFLECMTYRWLGHVGSNDDIDKGLRSRDELDSWIARCPIKQLERYLLKNAMITQNELKSIEENIEKEIQESLDYAESSSFPDAIAFERNSRVYKEC